MVKILVADDEFWIRKSITKKIHWEQLGASCSAEAEDGEQALKLFLETEPDIVITDMSMPQMDGVEFINKLRALKSTVKILIISGYSDFEYAKEAIRNKAEEYILKPIDEDILNETLEKIIRDIIKEKIILKKTKIQLLNRLVYEGINSNYYENDIEELNQYLNWEGYITFIMKFDETLQQQDGINSVIQSLINDECIVFKDYKNTEQAIGILKVKSEKDIYNYQTNFKEFLYKYNLNKQIKIKIALGSLVYSLDKIAESHFKALVAMENSSEELIIYDDNTISLKSKSTIDFNEETKGIILNSLQNGKKEEAKRIIFNKFNLIDQLPNGYCTLRDNLEKLFNYLYEQLKINVLEDKQKLFSKAQAPEILKEYIDEIIDELSDTCILNSDNYKSIVLQAKIYIENNYDKKLSLKGISERYHISEIYFSRIFKQESGENFISFLTKVRMEQSLNYLKNSSMKIIDIAIAVGYDDQRHFSKIFKKYYKCLPSELRKVNYPSLV